MNANVGGYRPDQNNVPPRIEFYMDAEEDREASLAAKAFIMRDVVMVRLRQAGSKDFCVQHAEEFVRQYEEYSSNGRSPPEWGGLYRDALNRYKAGNDGPTSGIDIRHAGIATPAQLQNLRTMGLLSVEDIATMNEATMGRVGMGAVALKGRAVAYLESAKNNTHVQEISQLRARDAAKDTQIADLQAQLTEINAKLSQAGTGKKG